MPEQQGLTDEQIELLRSLPIVVRDNYKNPDPPHPLHDDVDTLCCLRFVSWEHTGEVEITGAGEELLATIDRLAATPESPGSGRVVLEAEFCGGMITPVLDEGMDGTERLYSEWNVSVGAKPSPEASAALQAAYEIHGPVRVIIDPREQGDK